MTIFFEQGSEVTRTLNWFIDVNFREQIGWTSKVRLDSPRVESIEGLTRKFEGK